VRGSSADAAGFGILDFGNLYSGILNFGILDSGGLKDGGFSELDFVPCSARLCTSFTAFGPIE